MPIPPGTPADFSLRLRVDRPFVPGRGLRPDERSLGMFVHSVHVEGGAEAQPPAFAASAEALLRVPERAGRLVVALSSGGERWAAGRVEVNDGPARDYVAGPDESRVEVPVPAPHARVLKVRIVTDLVTPRAREGPPSPESGILVRSIRFE